MEKKVLYNGHREDRPQWPLPPLKQEVSAMAEGFDTLSEIGLVVKQLGTQSVTVRTRTAAQKLHYLRELIYDDLKWNLSISQEILRELTD